MAIEQFNEDVEVISKLGDLPNQDDGLTAEALKAKFDQASIAIKNFINNVLVPVINELEQAKDPEFIYGLDTTLSVEGRAAEAAAVGTALAGKYGNMRLLTASDNCNSLTQNGVYWYSTNSVPFNAPFPNAAVIEVYGPDSTTSQKIQRATRYGAGGCSATRALYGNNWCEWYHYTLTTDGVIPISMGGTGGTTIAEAQTKLHMSQYYLFAQMDNEGNKTSDGVDAYPKRPGVFRVTTGHATVGVPCDYGCLVIFNGGSFYGHLYFSGDGFWVGYTSSMKTPTWKKMAVAT